jgi:hypothetical protein
MKEKIENLENIIGPVFKTSVSFVALLLTLILTLHMSLSISAGSSQNFTLFFLALFPIEFGALGTR